MCRSDVKVPRDVNHTGSLTVEGSPLYLSV